MTTTNGDVAILRDLAQRYAEACSRDVYDERRELWRKHNSLVKTRPLIYARWLAAWPEAQEAQLQCEDPFFRGHETFLRQMLFQDTIGDDYIIEPWIAQRASFVGPAEGAWGVKVGRIPSPEPGGAWKYDPPLKAPEDLARLVEPHHVIDEEATERDASRLQDAVGDVIEVIVDRSPVQQACRPDLSTDLAYLRGLGQVMWDMADDPAWLHELLTFMRDGILAIHDEADAAGHWTLANHQNQAMSYAQELPDPQANGGPVKRDQLWAFSAAQEFALVSPAMHDEFMLRYQAPITEHFGLVAYGCCEDLTHKIDMLRQLPNLRRIAIAPVADVAKCAEQIQDEYVFSWRPNPAEMVCCGFDPGHVRKVVREAMEASQGCHVDITLKDVQTVEHDTGRIVEWTKIVREVADAY